jgi:NADPH:quinone reductase-like Zn-dependent oxidoreductase
MKAISIEAHGTADKLKLVDHPKPKPQGNEVLIKLHSAGLNHLDIWVRNGSPAYPVKLPHILGADGSGVVEELGPEAEGVSVGDRVLILPGISCGACEFCHSGKDNQCPSFEIVGAKRNGTFAEYVAVPDQNVVTIPESLSFETAAAFPLVYLTAWHMLVGRGQIKSEEKVLVLGAGAGVGIAAIQIAKLKGTHVYAVTTSANKVEMIKKCGADRVFIQNESEDFSKWIHKETDGKGMDIVVEHVGPATWDKSIKSLSKYGRLVTCGATTGPKVELDLRYVFSRNLSIFGARMGTQREFQELLPFIFSGKIKPLIDKTFSLEQAAEAQIYMEEKKQTGKILLKI